MARIVDTDNLGRDYPNEKFLLWDMPEVDAQAICDVLNHRSGPHSDRYYKVVSNDYTLEPGFIP